MKDILSAVSPQPARLSWNIVTHAVIPAAQIVVPINDRITSKQKKYLLKSPSETLQSMTWIETFNSKHNEWRKSIWNVSTNHKKINNSNICQASTYLIVFDIHYCSEFTGQFQYMNIHVLLI